jgi:glycosyltransferase involved in cell wall biosynthesis
VTAAPAAPGDAGIEAPGPAGKCRILFLTTGLGPAGAEHALVKLVTALDPARFACRVVSLGRHSDSSLHHRLRQAAVPCVELGLGRAVGWGPAILRLRRILRHYAPHAVQGWMYHGNVAAVAARWLSASDVPVLWNIRSSLYRLSDQRPVTRAVVRLGAMLSPTVDHVIYCATVSREQHEAFGYRGRHSVVLPNGFDVDTFAPSEASRRAVRHELGIPPGALVVGSVGRDHPAKDHETLLRAAALVMARQPSAVFLLAGRGLDPANGRLASLVERLALPAGAVRLLGHRDDIPRVMAALDVLCLSSRLEGFPNVLGEAMACGVTCVTTDVGVAAELVAGIGEIVPPGDPARLAAGLLAVLELPPEERAARGRHGRARVVDRYRLGDVIRRYEALYEPLGPRPGRGVVVAPAAPRHAPGVEA